MVGRGARKRPRRRVPRPERSNAGPAESHAAEGLPRREGASGVIILRHRWSRIIFFGALALIVVVALLLRFL